MAKSVSQLTLELKSNGFPQRIDFRDTAIAPKTMEVSHAENVELPTGRDWLRIPAPVSLISQLETENISYTLIHEGGKYTIETEEPNAVHFENPSLWTVLAELWLSKRSK